LWGENRCPDLAITFLAAVNPMHCAVRAARKPVIFGSLTEGEGRLYFILL